MTNGEAKNKIARKLKSLRNKTGLTIKDVRELLANREIDVAENTLYGYENGVSSPTVNVFLALCDIYQVNNILAEFGYGDNTIPDIPAVYLFWTPLLQVVEKHFGENSKESFQILKYFADAKDDKYIPLQYLLSGKDLNRILRDLKRDLGIDLEPVIRRSFPELSDGTMLPKAEDAALIKKINMLDEKAKKEIDGYLSVKLAEASNLSASDEFQAKTG